MRLLCISKPTSENPVFYKGYEPKYTPVLVYFSCFSCFPFCKTRCRKNSAESASSFLIESFYLPCCKK